MYTNCTSTVVTHPTASPVARNIGLDRACARVVVLGRSRVTRGAFWFDLLSRVASPSQPSGNDSRMLSGTRESRRSLPYNPVKQSFHHVKASLHTWPTESAADQPEGEEPSGTSRPAPTTPNPRSALFLLISVRAVVPSSSAANRSAPSSSSRGTTSGFARAAK